MNCQGFDTDIGDYIDGTLHRDAAVRLEVHLTECASCTALAADLRAIRTAARTLGFDYRPAAGEPGREIEPPVPPPHLWTAISSAVQARQSRWWGLTSGAFAWEPLAAAAMAVLLTTGLAWVGGSLAPLAQPGNVPARAVVSFDAVQQAEEQYVAAIAGLEQITRDGGATLDAETADVLQANLTVIDRAIGESRAALDTEPESRLVIESLFEALRSKVALLQDMVALINEMRKGNQEGAARILSELNQ